MEVYLAMYDYEKEREDILSFKEGDKFWIVSKADKRWWAAYAMTADGDRGDYGYVPSSYLQRFMDPSAGELAQELAETAAGEQKRVTLKELKTKIPRKPPAAPNTTGEDEEPEVVIIKPLKTLAQPPEDCPQIEPKRLPNPYRESKVHHDLHRELKLENARGGIKNLGKPELEVVMQRRRLDADGKPGPIKAKQASQSRGTTTNSELASQLARRTLLLEEAEKQETAELEKPEFMKVSLRKAH